MATTEVGNGSSNHSSQASTSRLLLCGVLAPVAFWATTVICGLVLGDYNHLSMIVSELGAIGTPSRFLFTAGLVSCSILSVLFIIGVRRMCERLKLSTIPVWIIVTHAFSIAGAGLFPLPLPLHGILGLPSLALILSPLTALLLWPRAHSLSNVRVMACLSFAIMSLGFLAFSPTILGALPGLKQRFFHLGWSIWFIYLSVGFIQAIKDNQVEPRPLPA